MPAAFDRAAIDPLRLTALRLTALSDRLPRPRGRSPLESHPIDIVFGPHVDLSALRSAHADPPADGAAGGDAAAAAAAAAAGCGGDRREAYAAAGRAVTDAILALGAQVRPKGGGRRGRRRATADVVKRGRMVVRVVKRGRTVVKRGQGRDRRCPGRESRRSFGRLKPTVLLLSDPQKFLSVTCLE